MPFQSELASSVSDVNGCDLYDVPHCLEVFIVDETRFVTDKLEK